MSGLDPHPAYHGDAGGGGALARQARRQAHARGRPQDLLKLSRGHAGAPPRQLQNDQGCVSGINCALFYEA